MDPCNDDPRSFSASRLRKNLVVVPIFLNDVEGLKGIIGGCEKRSKPLACPVALTPNLFGNGLIVQGVRDQ